MRAKDVLGRRGEELAAGYLEAHGMRILDRNWRCPEGEIDIVALDGDAEKLARLHRLAAAWSREHQPWRPLHRLDVVAVLDDGTGAPVLEHLKGVG